MILRDVAFWARSARADAHLGRLRDEHGTARAFDLLYEKLEDPWATVSQGREPLKTSYLRL
jgi:hypothetical protein